MIDVKLFLLLLYAFKIVNTEENPFPFRCGFDDNEIAPIIIAPITPEGNEKRKLDDMKIFIYI